LCFDLIVPGDHPLALASAASENLKLVTTVNINFDGNASAADRKFAISLSFFNPNEIFDIKTYFDNAAVSCRIECRLPGVKVKTGASLSSTATGFALEVVYDVLKGMILR
jgi:hypothetical protein